MYRKPYLLAVVGLYFCCLATGQEDAVEVKLSTARSDYQKAVEKLRGSLSGELRKKAEAAQKAGDLKGLEAVEAEVKAFEDKGVLPKSVPTKSYDAGLRLAKAKLEDAYSAAVKEYTKAGQRAQAKAVQLELDDFKSGTVPQQIEQADALQKSTEWTGTRDMGAGNDPWSLRVSERRGEQVKGTVVIGKQGVKSYEYTGTVRKGTVVFTTIKKEGDNFEQKFEGTLKGPDLTGRMSGSSSQVGFVSGSASLQLKK